MKKLPIMPVQCSTCPFRDGGWTYLRPLLVQRAISDGTPICHSTGLALTKRVRGRAHLCRGARDLQLMIFHRIGFIEARTDEAWDKKCVELNMN